MAFCQILPLMIALIKVEDSLHLHSPCSSHFPLHPHSSCPDLATFHCRILSPPQVWETWHQAEDLEEEGGSQHLWRIHLNTKVINIAWYIWQNDRTKTAKLSLININEYNESKSGFTHVVVACDWIVRSVQLICSHGVEAWSLEEDIGGGSLRYDLVL